MAFAPPAFMAFFIGGNMVIEDGVVEREAEADGVRGREAGGGVGGGGVRRLRAGRVL